jgi:hypothetical protein
MEFESRPEVLLSANTTKADKDRLLLWLQHNPRLHFLVGEAIELQDGATARR